MSEHLTDILPADWRKASLVGRVWKPGEDGGPCVVALRAEDVVDLTRIFPTISDVLNAPQPSTAIRDAIAAAPVLCRAKDVAMGPSAHGEEKAFRLLAPCDLQAVKAAGVTFATSLLERVVEERARGDRNLAAELRQKVTDAIGTDLATLKPGSAQAAQLKTLLIAEGLWSQYLEVGIGPDAEIFTKCQPMSAVGAGADIGIHPKSEWNNPEPELVLAVSARGEIVGAALGNDVNLRDVEGRSALLLGKAKDNNGSTSIGPFIRLLDTSFSLDDIRGAVVDLKVSGNDGFAMSGASSMAQISRDVTDLVAQMMGAYHQYPDGALLFTGTMFAPVQDRGAPGRGFTHQLADRVEIASPKLGRLINTVGYADRIAPWHFGARALMSSLAARGHLHGRNSTGA